MNKRGWMTVLCLMTLEYDGRKFGKIISSFMEYYYYHLTIKTINFFLCILTRCHWLYRYVYHRCEFNKWSCLLWFALSHQLSVYFFLSTFCSKRIMNEWNEVVTITHLWQFWNNWNLIHWMKMSFKLDINITDIFVILTLVILSLWLVRHWIRSTMKCTKCWRINYCKINTEHWHPFSYKFEAKYLSFQFYWMME